MMALIATRADAASEDYRLGPGDLVRIVVFDHDEMNLDARISQSGNITFPLVGQVSGRRTVDPRGRAAAGAASHRRRLLKQPEVSILVEEYQSQKVSVMGQVAKPGQYPLDASKRMLDMLAMAGGLLNDSGG